MAEATWYKRHKLLLYDTEWQRLRVSCLKEHHAQGGWTTVEGTRDNLKRLDAYVQAAERGSAEEQVRMWRVINLLNATRMGYSGQGLQASGMDVRVFEARNYYQQRYIGKEAWDDIDLTTFGARQVKALRTLPQYWFSAIYTNLSTRRKLHADSKYRDELSWYLDLMDQVSAE